MLMVIGSLGAATSMRGVQPDSSATTATVSTPALFFIVVPHFPCLSNRGEGGSPHAAQTILAACPQSAGCARGQKCKDSGSNTRWCPVPAARPRQDTSELPSREQPTCR